MRVEVDVILDDVLDGCCAIVCMDEEKDGAGWLLYLPNETPCICNDFAGAAQGMREWLKQKRRASK